MLNNYINWKRPYESSIWKKLRSNHLQLFPYCINCDNTLLLHVDHIIEHQNDLNLFTDVTNLQTLCAKCHAVKTNQDQSWVTLKKNNNLKIQINFNAKHGIQIVNDFWFFKSIDNVEVWGNKIQLNFKQPLQDITYNLAHLIYQFIIQLFLKYKTVTHEFITQTSTTFNPNWYFERKLKNVNNSLNNKKL